jgi:hypothetical protein
VTNPGSCDIPFGNLSADDISLFDDVLTTAEVI